MNIKYIILLIIFSIIIIPYIFRIDLNRESFQNYHMAQPTKCFSCEKELPHNSKFMGGPSKCFSCEKEISKMKGSEYSDLAQPTKCFSCEKQFHKL